MTVCIAAVCMEGQDFKIVMCADSQGSTFLGNKPHVLKVRGITRTWRCLTAGSDDDLNALLPAIKAEFARIGAPDETNVPAALRAALTRRKVELCDEFTRGKYGMTFDDFMSKGKSSIPDDMYRDDLSRIASIRPNVECIVAGFCGQFPMLCSLSGSSEVRIFEDFLVVGEGAYLAQSALINRGQTEVKDLCETIYCVYEAKRHAERVSSVNDRRTMIVLSSDGTFKLIAGNGLEYLESIYADISQKPIPTNVLIADDHYDKGN